MIDPGIVCLLGGGASIPASGKTHEYLAQQLPRSPRVAILETPAGFELNSDIVAGKLATFMQKRLQNYAPRIEIIAARKKGTPFSPDNHDIVAPILSVDEIVLGPGSPTYGAKQLKDSLALDYIKARQWQGGTLLISSSATLSFSQFTMPVYEIYKVGEELHWKKGVNYFADYGLDLTIVPHWDNNDGGTELDTSRCYVGQARFDPLFDMLPKQQTVLGLDDHTSVNLDFRNGTATVVGARSITIIRDGNIKVFKVGEQFSIDEFGAWHLPEESLLSEEVWLAAKEGWQARLEADAKPAPPLEVVTLADQRKSARANKDWALADQLRTAIETTGWSVRDTPNGYELEPQ
ncbi:MAG: cysteinyl-tRNA synthetase [Chloroflexota bacterium]